MRMFCSGQDSVMVLALLRELLNVPPLLFMPMATRKTDRKAIDGLGKGEVRVLVVIDNTVEDVAGNYYISFIIDCFLVAHCNSLYCMYPFVFCILLQKILVSVLGHADRATLLGIHA